MLLKSQKSPLAVKTTFCDNSVNVRLCLQCMYACAFPVWTCVCVCRTVGNGGLYHSLCRLTSPSLSNGCQAARIAGAERENEENEHERESV